MRLNIFLCYFKVAKWHYVTKCCDLIKRLNKKLFSVGRPSGFKNANWNFFSHVFFVFVFQILNLISRSYSTKNEKQKKRKFPTSRLTENDFSFKGGLTYTTVHRSLNH